MNIDKLVNTNKIIKIKKIYKKIIIIIFNEANI